jgi:transposase-like protein
MSTSESPARQQWRDVVERQRASGLSMAAFCRRESVRASLFYAWNRRLREEGASSGFVEAKLVGERRSLSSIQIRLRGGRRLLVRRGFDRSLLAEIVSVVEGLP